MSLLPKIASSVWIGPLIVNGVQPVAGTPPSTARKGPLVEVVNDMLVVVAACLLTFTGVGNAPGIRVSEVKSADVADATIELRPAASRTPWSTITGDREVGIDIVIVSRIARTWVGAAIDTWAWAAKPTIIDARAAVLDAMTKFQVRGVEERLVVNTSGGSRKRSTRCVTKVGR